MPLSFRGLPLALAAIAALAAPAVASAAEPATQVPGYYRAAIGSLRVTALFDGTVPLARSELVGVTPARLAALLENRYVPETPKGLQTAVNAYLVERDGTRMLVDAGTAQCFGPGLGQVPANLRAAGFSPGDVDVVLLTHAHPDHACGLLDADGGMAYPNAQVWLAGEEVDHWNDREAEARTAEGMRFLFDLARRALAPYEKDGRVHRLGNDDALPKGVGIVATPGHTPGHRSFLLDGGSAKLLVWGDVLHYHAVQFAMPEASYEADVDRARAITSRREVLAGAAREGWWVAGAHLPFPGLGHVRGEGKAFAWVPAEFSPYTPTP